MYFKLKVIHQIDYILFTKCIYLNLSMSVFQMNTRSKNVFPHQIQSPNLQRKIYKNHFLDKNNIL
jgi:hypothetical protein